MEMEDEENKNEHMHEKGVSKEMDHLIKVKFVIFENQYFFQQN